MDYEFSTEIKNEPEIVNLPKTVPVYFMDEECGKAFLTRNDKRIMIKFIINKNPFKEIEGLSLSVRSKGEVSNENKISSIDVTEIDLISNEEI